jgi:hypothetical protein
MGGWSRAFRTSNASEVGISLSYQLGAVDVFRDSVDCIVNAESRTTASLEFGVQVRWYASLATRLRSNLGSERYEHMLCCHLFLSPSLYSSASQAWELPFGTTQAPPGNVHTVDARNRFTRGIDRRFLCIQRNATRRDIAAHGNNVQWDPPTVPFAIGTTRLVVFLRCMATYRLDPPTGLDICTLEAKSSILIDEVARRTRRCVRLRRS